MQTTTKAGITAADWGETDGKKVSLYTLTNKNGVQVTITNYGGTVTSWLAPDRNGNKGNIVLGFDKLRATWISRRTLVRWWDAMATALQMARLR